MNKWKKAMAVVAAGTMLGTSLVVSPYAFAPQTVMAAEATDLTKGVKVGDNITATLADGVLTLRGTGEMYAYAFSFDSPMYNNKQIERVVVEDGVTSIGDDAFSSCNSLSSIEIPNSVTSIGKYAFWL